MTTSLTKQHREPHQVRRAHLGVEQHAPVIPVAPSLEAEMAEGTTTDARQLEPGGVVVVAVIVTELDLTPTAIRIAEVGAQRESRQEQAVVVVASPRRLVVVAIHAEPSPELGESSAELGVQLSQIEPRFHCDLECLHI